MGGEDKFHKIQDEQTRSKKEEKRQKNITKKKKQNRMDEINEANESKLCSCLTTGAIFKLFGLLDLGIFFMLVTLYIRGSQNFGNLYLFFLLFFLPNILLFIVVMLNDSVQTRKFYSAVLITKIVIQGIGLPVAIITVDNVTIS